MGRQPHVTYDEGQLQASTLIVPAHNEEPVIGGALESLMRLDYDPYCAIVVNDGSTDSTAWDWRSKCPSAMRHGFGTPFDEKRGEARCAPQRSSSS
jgi:hypothetical protein